MNFARTKNLNSVPQFANRNFVPTHIELFEPFSCKSILARTKKGLTKNLIADKLHVLHIKHFYSTKKKYL